MSPATLRVVAISAILVVVFLTLGPVDMRSASPVDSGLDRVAAWGVIGTLFVLAFPGRLPAVCAVLALLVVGLEFAQNLLPDRHGQVGDAIVKLVGLAAGLLAGWIVVVRQRRG
jgi:hypothetical protein